MKKAVLFDLDGTLWHTCDVILPVWNDILKKHKKTIGTIFLVIGLIILTFSLVTLVSFFSKYMTYKETEGKVVDA